MNSTGGRRARIAPLYASYIPVGIATTMMGPLVPGFQARWQIDDRQAGLLFTAQFLASVITGPLLAPLARRWGYFGLIFRGLLMVALGAAGCAAGSWVLGLAGAAVCGIGVGFVIATANLALAAMVTGESARPVLWLNATWSTGAMLSAPLVAALGGAFLWSLAAAAFASAIAVRAVCPMDLRPAQPGWAGQLTDLPYALLLFLYVGAETAVAGWMSSYALRSSGGRDLWAVLPSLFWGSVLAGRVASPAVLRRLRAPILAVCGMGLAFAGSALLLSSGSAPALVAAAILAGLGMAPVFPLVVSQYADHTRGGQVSGLVFAAGGLGGAAVPAVVGGISSSSGSLQLGLTAVLAVIAVMLWMQIRLAASPAGR